MAADPSWGNLNWWERAEVFPRKRYFGVTRGGFLQHCPHLNRLEGWLKQSAEPLPQFLMDRTGLDLRICIIRTFLYDLYCVHCSSGKHTLGTTAHSKQNKIWAKDYGKRNQGCPGPVPRRTRKSCLSTHEKPTKNVSVTCHGHS